MSASTPENPGLCWKCQTVLNTQYKDGLEVLEVEDIRMLRTSDPLQTTATDGCALCRLLLHSLSVPNGGTLEQWMGVAEDGTLPTDIKHEHCVNIDEYSGDIWLSVALKKGNGQMGNNLLSTVSTGSDASRAIVADWLDRCVKTHPTCKPPPAQKEGSSSRPSRVLDCSTATPKLLVVRDDTPPFPYATVSHCWGAHMPLCLLSSNLAALQVSIPVAQLSRTFQDAIQILPWLGLSHLWIDSLCIIQDSPEDWARESALMADVYSNSHCNVAAAHAADGTYGCFIERDPGLVAPLKVELNWGSVPGVYYAVQPEIWQQDVLETPLNSRAWVCQERYLAPRNLFFGETQLFWDCHNCSACESFPTGLPPGVSRPSKSLDPHISGARIRRQWSLSDAPELDAFSLWGELVEQCSQGHLTFPGDKLVALSGLASRMQQHIQSDYLAGLWRKHLPYQLLWHIDMRAPAERLRTAYTAPSWSWASVHGGVINQACWVADADDREILLEIQDVKTQLVNEANSFGQVKAGYIRATGYLSRAGVHLQPEPNSHVSFSLFIEDNKVGSAVVELCKREEEPATRDEEASVAHHGLYYLPIRNDKRGSKLEGLALKETPPGSGEFVRFGKFWIDEEAIGSFQALCREHSTGSQQDGTTEDTKGWGPKLEFTMI
ncbi:hypothetical protein PG984_007315 [Apiospora sp. TS-2023a]